MVYLSGELVMLVGGTIKTLPARLAVPVMLRNEAPPVEVSTVLNTPLELCVKLPVRVSGVPETPGCRVPLLVTLAMVQLPLATQLALLATVRLLPVPKLVMVLAMVPVPINWMASPVPAPPLIAPVSEEP